MLANITHNELPHAGKFKWLINQLILNFCKKKVAPAIIWRIEAAIWCIVLLAILLNVSVFLMYWLADFSPSYILLINLALADLLLVLNLPIRVDSLEWDVLSVRNTFLCYVFSSVKNIFATVSSLMLVAISYDRFRSTTMSQTPARKQYWLICAGIWLFSLVTSIPALARVEFDSATHECRFFKRRF